MVLSSQNVAQRPTNRKAMKAARVSLKVEPSPQQFQDDLVHVPGEDKLILRVAPAETADELQRCFHHLGEQFALQQTKRGQPTEVLSIGKHRLIPAASFA